MPSLKHTSGLPITLAGDVMHFSPKLKHERVQKRHYKGNEAFFMPFPKKTLPIFDKSDLLYYIYRNVRFPAHTPLFKKQGVRFDITVLCAGHIGTEAIRTIGHIHKKSSTQDRPAELYQVISGKAIFYLQHEIKKEAVCVNAQKGSFVFIPGSYAHITINASKKEPLVIANIFTDKRNASDYSFFKKTHGPAWYPIWKGNRLIFEKNPRAQRYGIKKRTAAKTGPLYTQFIQELI